MNVDKRFFETVMASKKLSMRALAAKMDRSHSQLSLMFSGQRRMQLDEAIKLSELLGVPLQRIAEAAGAGQARSGARRVSVIGAMTPSGTVDVYPAGTVERTYAPATDLPEDLVAVQARTADSPASWMDAWVFFCAPTSTIEPDAIGRFCMTRIENGETVMATVRRGYRDGTYNLSGPYTRDSVRLEWATPILLTRM